MKNMLRIRTWAVVSGLTAILCAGSGAAFARDVVWSVGVGAPGVNIGLSNAPPVVFHRPVMQAQPVYWQQPAVYVQPQPVYYPQPSVVYYAQPQVIVAPQPYYRGWGPRHHWHGDRWDHGHHGFDEGRGDHGRR